MTRALVVVPTYNEAATIPTALDRVLSADPDLEVLVVDDGSPDGTGDLVAERTASEPRVHLLRRTDKDGLGAAYRAGFAWGMQRGYDVLVEMDADLSHPADRLPALLAAAEHADLVIGSRYVPGGATANWSPTRRLISRTGNAYVRLALGVSVRDATAGFRAFRRETLERIDVTGLTSNGYCFQVETLWRAVQAGCRVVEVPITFTERAAGTSKMSSAIVAEALLRVTGWALRDGRAPNRHRVAQGAGGTGGRVRRAALLLPLLVLAGALAWATTGAAAAPAATKVAGPAGTTGAGPGGPGSSAPPTGSPSASAGVPGPAAAAPAEVPGAAALPAPAAPAEAVPAGERPTEVVIPAIGVRSSLVPLGVAADGTMEVPTDYARAGWLTTAPVPGERGPAVIAGHVDSTSGPAVFFRLRELRPGDEVQVRRTDGSTVAFTVERVERYPKDAFPTGEVYGPAPGPVLRLITCGGTFDRSTGHYRDNIVVFASIRA